MASQTEFDGHVRTTAGTGGAAREIEHARLTGSGVITPAEFDAIKANAVGSASGVGSAVAARRLSRASLAHIRWVRAVPRSDHNQGVPVLSGPLNGMRQKRSQNGAGRTLTRVAVAVLTSVALIAAAGCGSSKPAYCSDRTNLENSIKTLPSVTSSSGISGLKTQITTIQSDATSLVSAAKSDFPSVTSAVKSSVDTLQSAVKALPSSPSATQIAAIAADVASVTSSVKSFVNTSKSKCS